MSDVCTVKYVSVTRTFAYKIRSTPFGQYYESSTLVQNNSCSAAMNIVVDLA